MRPASAIAETPATVPIAAVAPAPAELEASVSPGLDRPAPAEMQPARRPVQKPEAWRLKPVILDPGHGGQDLGAVFHGHMEKEISLSVARKIQARLDQHGFAGARLTRDKDETTPLDQRVQSSLDWDGSIFVSIHVNQVKSKRRHGVIVYSFGRGSPWQTSHRRRVAPLPNPTKQQSQSGAMLAASIYYALKKAGLAVSNPDRENYYVLKNPRLPSTLIELGFISNADEAKLLTEPAYQDRLADAITSGIEAYLSKRKDDPRLALTAKELLP